MCMLIITILFLILSKFTIKMYFSSSMMFLLSFFFSMNLFWMDWWSIFLNLSINMYSLSLIMLTFWIFGIVIMNLCSEDYKNLLFKLVLLMVFLLLMNFMSMSLIIYYFLFEINLLVIFFMVIMWGQGKMRSVAGFYLMFYTLVFSLPLITIISMIFINNKTLIFPLLEMNKINMNNFVTNYMLLSFLVKIPFYSIHSWLLKAHVEASYLGSMILAAIMLKLGSYGMLRLLLFLKVNNKINILILSFSLIGSIILSFVCLRQIDMKVIVAMSSIVHMGLMISSLVIMYKTSFIGSYFVMISHGLCSSSLFYLINIVYSKTSSRLMFFNKGLIVFMPSMTMMWFLCCSSNMAAPPSLNLVSEIITLISLFSWMDSIIVLLMMYCTMSFIYSLYLFSYINHGETDMMKFFNLGSGKILNFITILIHWVPLNIIILNLNMII